MNRFHRYFKKCEEFALCAEVGDANVIGIEDAKERYTLYQIVVKGSGRMGKIFENDYIVGDANGVYFADLKISLLKSDTIKNDFNIIRSSKLAILSNSTFSWWASFLSNSKKEFLVPPNFTLEEKRISLPNETIII